MRVLIMSVTAGYGHNSTARAIASLLESRGAEVVVEDMYQQFSQLTYELIDKGYLFSVRHLKRQFKSAYNSLERNEVMRRIVSFLSGNDLYARRYAGYFEEYMPDVIVATHVFAAQMLNILKKKGFLKIPVIGIITDYCIHPFWEEAGSIDYIITGSELLTYAAIKRGISPGLILPLGIPVRPAFRGFVPKEQAKKLLGLNEASRSILVMGGSMGYGNILSVVSSIDSMDMELQIICICGRNEKLRQRLHYLKTKSDIVIRGFVDNPELYMDAVDCIVTKPGGLTVTEVMCKKLPMILIDPIPGHEERNADFLTNNGAAMRVTNYFSIAEAVYYLFSKPERLELMRRSIELIAHPDATEKICDVIYGLAQNKK